jgi:predicted membrane protein
MSQQNSQSRIVLGAIIIVFGVLALIDNMHIFESFNILSFWPTVFIVVGLLKVFQTHNRSGFVVGAFLVAIGIFLTLEHLGLLYFHIHDWWPLFLIGAGVLVLSKGSDQNDLGRRIRDNLGIGRVHAAAGEDGNLDGLSYMNVASVMSGSTRRNDTQNFHGGELTAIMGGMEIDLRQASMESEATINVFAVWGGIVIKVPADWSVVSRAIPILGGAVDQTIPPQLTSKRLIIDGYVVMGGMEIKN